MNYHVGQRLIWVPYYNHDYGNQRIVEVVELRKRGCAKLSNGWVVDEDGEAEGTDRIPGGNVIEAVFAPPGFVDDCIGTI